MWEGLKKIGKNKKIKNSSSSALVGTRGRGTSPSAGSWHSGKRSHSPSARARHSGKTFFNFLANGSVQCCRQMQLFFFVCPSSPSVGLPRVSCPFRHSGKPPFPECNSSSSATLGEAECLIFGTQGSVWHSGNLASPVVPGLICFCL
jgi:hypothetical protein